MLTTQALKAWGADTDAGLARCMNMEAFYLKLVNMELADKNFDLLAQAMADGNAKAAFEASHALKGATGNLGLTPLFDPASALTEALRGTDSMPDTGDLAQRIADAIASLRALAAE